jgi:mannan endo-1,4-beta-mannosidase
MFMRVVVLTVIALAAAQAFRAQAAPFVRVTGHQFTVNGRPYYFVGANYWYGPLLGLERDKRRGIERLRRELDFLKANGVTNLRLMAGAEGTGPLNGVTRVGPALQPEQGKFDERVAAGLDLVLAEMGKRGMRAVIFLSNNWEWSGGFQQYLIWNGVIDDKWLVNKPSWDELRDNVARFYSCTPCKDAYAGQAAYVLGRRNRITRVRYVDDPVIMAWEIANEPRPMRPTANEDYRKWLAETAAMIKSRDSQHLVTIGHEGRIGTESLELFEKVHADPNIDYLTIHIWPKNWGWFAPGKLAEDFPNAVEQTEKYIEENTAVAVKLNKPLVIEPRWRAASRPPSRAAASP